MADKKISQFTDYSEATLATNKATTYFGGYDSTLPLGSRNIRSSLTEVLAWLQGEGITQGAPVTGASANRILYTDNSGNLATDTNLRYTGTQVQLGDGSAATPFLANVTNTGTGLFFSRDTNIQRLSVAIGGTEELRIFRNTVTGAAGVSINDTTDPTAALRVRGNGTALADKILTLFNSTPTELLSVGGNGEVILTPTATALNGFYVSGTSSVAHFTSFGATSTAFNAFNPTGVNYGGRKSTNATSWMLIDYRVATNSDVSNAIVFRLEANAGLPLIDGGRIGMQFSTRHPPYGTGDIYTIARFFALNVSSTAESQVGALVFHTAINSYAAAERFRIQGRNFGFNTTSFGTSSDGVLSIGNRTAAPTGNPTDAFLLYSESGNARMRSGGGTILNFTARTGWATATGTATRTTFDTATVTTEQLAQRVKALIDDLYTGAFGILAT